MGAKSPSRWKQIKEHRVAIGVVAIIFVVVIVLIIEYNLAFDVSMLLCCLSITLCSLSGGFLLTSANRKINHIPTNCKHYWNNKQLHPVPKGSPWLVLFSSDDCTSVCAADGVCYCYFVIPVEASPIEPVPYDNQYNCYYQDDCNNQDSYSMLLYFLPP